MAEISRYFFLRHLRGESSAHILHHRGGETAHSGRGLSFWFLPMSASISELPMDDRELSILFHGRSQDFQDITVQAVVNWRVAAPELAASRIDFSVDLKTGLWRRTPLETIAQMLTEQAQQLAWSYLARNPLQTVLVEGVAALRELLVEGLSLGATGLELVGVSVSAIRPTAEVEKALQMPTREAIQQESDRATFERRAIAVERERAIAENELQNKIELARREETLIEQRGQNQKSKATRDAEANRIGAEALAERTRMKTDAEASGIRAVETARVEAERERVAIYQDLPQEILMGLAARELAGNLPTIEHLQISPDMIGPMLNRLASAGARRLEEQ